MDQTRSYTLPFDDPIDAFCVANHVALAPTGEGPLSGLTFAAKDVFHVADHKTGFGSPTWLATHEAAAETAEAIRRLLVAGARMVGKTHSDELAYSLTGENVHYGTPVNVRAPDRIPGGSSNGSAAAVAAGLVDFALGTDCGGSVRLPASYCGILGMRPGAGRVPLTGVIPFGPPFDVAGWFARDATVFEAVGRVLMQDETRPPPPARVLVAGDAFALVDVAVRDALAPVVDRLADGVGARAEVTVSEEGLSKWFETFRVLQAASIWENHGEWVTCARPEFGPGVRERFEWAAALDGATVAAARARLPKIKDQLAATIADGNVLCIPTSPRVAPHKGTPVDDIEIRYRHQAMHLLCIAGLGGLPQASLPLADLDGLPLGLSLIGPPGSDAQLLGLATHLCGG